MEMKNELPPSNLSQEEIAKMEKSRTVSDAGLLEGGAEYSVNEKGEKENLLVTNEQSKELHNEFLEEEIKKAKEIVNTLFIEDIKKFLLGLKDRGYDDKLEWKHPEISNENREWRELLFKLEKEVSEKVSKLPDSKRLLAEKIKPHESAEVEGRFVCPACIFFALMDHGDDDLARMIFW